MIRFAVFHMEDLVEERNDRRLLKAIQATCSGHSVDLLRFAKWLALQMEKVGFICYRGEGEDIVLHEKKTTCDDHEHRLHWPSLPLLFTIEEDVRDFAFFELDEQIVPIGFALAERSIL